MLNNLTCFIEGIESVHLFFVFRQKNVLFVKKNV